MDAISIFLNGLLEVEIYIEQLEGFFDANKKEWFVDYTRLYIV